ncbi:MAG: DUF2817 domain-containing protein [Cohaesibacteraceae bacterium]|nr:DUF2817 domain-containing protein [Cohaesibacteraceae bacterium]
MVAHTLYSTDYFKARGKFLERCYELGLPIETIPHPKIADMRGPVAVDVVRIGSGSAKNVLFISSGVHGTELTTGSAHQLGLLDIYPQNLPEDVAVVMVHAVNPVGSARCTRPDENNVDLNRNYRNFEQDLPENADYANLHSAICTPEWTGSIRESKDIELADYVAIKGKESLTQRVLAGQYHFPDGLFYGGTERSWCVGNFVDILKRYGAGAKRAAILDIHTGLGPKGFGEIMRMHEIPRETADWKLIGGLVVDALDELDHIDDPMKIILEFGTLPFAEILQAHRGDNWLAFRSPPNTPLAPEIKKQVKDALFINERVWCAQTLARSLSVAAAMIDELDGSAGALNLIDDPNQEK